MAISQTEFDEWKQHPVTKRLLGQIQKDLEQMKDLLMFVPEEDLKHLQGRCAATTNLLLVEYGDLYESF